MSCILAGEGDGEKKKKRKKKKKGAGILLYISMIIMVNSVGSNFPAETRCMNNFILFLFHN